MRTVQLIGGATGLPARNWDAPLLLLDFQFHMLAARERLRVADIAPHHPDARNEFHHDNPVGKLVGEPGLEGTVHDRIGVDLT